ncbi:mitochondrial mRNA pseudouridine synthase Rpusd3-like isoform X2 [Thrips palmi]|nr:mitochondrial mRNA pseudouridine synthase Rpusd3-like isoform X2 [Thrips palmi]
MSSTLTIKSSQLRNLLCNCAPLRNKFDSVSKSSSSFHAAAENEQRRKEHTYVRRWKYVNVESTSKYLLGQIIYNKDGIVAINKPPDLGSSKEDCSIYHTLPFLAKELGYKYLKLVKVPEKSISGITILVADAALAEEVSKSIRRSKALFSDDPKQTFLALTVGHPLKDEGSERFAVKIQNHENQKHCYIVRKWTENERKRRDVNIGVVSHKVVAQCEQASLVSVSTWQEHAHCPRVFLSDILLSPALGDKKFGTRVSSLFGKPVLLKPWIAPAVKALPPPLLKHLSVLSGSEGSIPMHLHLQELTLHGFKKDNSDLILRADPPEFFLWSCKQLNLELPTVDRIDQPVELSEEIERKNQNNIKMI